MLLQAKERAPTRQSRLIQKAHIRLPWKAIGLPRVTRKTGSDDVLPGRLPSLAARDDMIKVELGFRKQLRAILTSVLVAQEDILPREFHLLAGKPVVEPQYDDLGNPQRELHGMNDICRQRTLRLSSILSPRTHVMGLVAEFPLSLDHLGMPQAKEAQCAFHRAGMHRLPETVQDQNRTFE